MSDPFAEIDRDAARAVFAALGCSATLYPHGAGSPQSVTVILNQSLTLTSEFGPIVEDRDNIGFLLSECQPTAGDRVLITDDHYWYQLDQITPNGDDHVVRRMYALESTAPQYGLLTASAEMLVTAGGDHMKAL